MRTWISVAIFSGFLAAICSPAAAQNNPKPFVNNPLAPAATAPGGPGLTVTVNGAGFVNGAVVRWNGSARATTFVSPAKLTAVIPASDVAVEATVFVTVSNPGPGGGISNAVFFEVTTPTTSLAFNRTDSSLPVATASIEKPVSLTVFDLTNTGNSYLAVLNGACPIELNCILEKASIAFASGANLLAYQTFTGVSPNSIGSGDFDGDGLLDLITVGAISYSILPNKIATSLAFPRHNDYTLPANCGTPFVLGDFNGDGHLDVVLSGTSGFCFLPGIGDGTFGATSSYNLGTLAVVSATGDFNGDGKLDLAVSNVLANTISILSGNGDGTFQPPSDLTTSLFPQNIVAADFNGDGKLDLAAVNNFTKVSIFLGNGNGTFQPRVDYTGGVTIQAMTAGDYNGDGNLDLAVSDSICPSFPCPATGSVNILLGNGDGTFQSHLDFADGGQPGPVTTGSFHFVSGSAAGRLGFATTNNQQNTISVFDAIATGTVNPIPTISSISPVSALINSGAFTLTVNGTNFISGSTVYFAGQARVTTFVSATQLSAAIQAGDLASARAVDVFAANPAPGGGNSTTSIFIVYGPPPTISSLSPSSVVAGGPAFTLTVVGLNFVNGAVINVNGAARSTAFASSTQLTTGITANDIANQGTINISVTDPVTNGSGGGTSSPLPLTILPANTQPVVGGLTPASATAGGSAFTLILAGTGFTAGSVVTFNSNVVTSAFVSATQLQAAIPASSIAVAGTPFVTVANPGGPPSVVATFTVNNPVPGASSLSPSTLPAGNVATTLNVTGTNFTTSSTILVNGISRTTTFVSSTALRAALPASDFAHSGVLTITVSNPVPGGGTTSALTLVVEDFQLSVSAPSKSVTAGQQASYALLVTPSNGTTANPLVFAVTGLPTGVTASFSPSATIPAGSSLTNVTMTVSTTSRSSITQSIRQPEAIRLLPPRTWAGVLVLLVFMWLLFLQQLLKIHGLNLSQGSSSFLHTLTMLIMSATVCLCIFQLGCGASNSSSSSGTPINITGNWSLSTTSSKFIGQTTISGTIAQNNSIISGSLNISGSPCATSASLTGALNGSSITASLDWHGQTVSLTGSVSPDGNSASGSYSSSVGGCTNGDAGTWAGTRSGSTGNPNGTPAGTYPIVVTASSGGGSLTTTVMLTVM